MKKTKNTNKGITLIALIITIIVLLILAGVALATLTGDSGILSNAEKAKEETLLANSREQVQLAVQEALVEGYGTVTKTNLVNALNKIIGEGNYTITPDDEIGPWTVTVIKTGYTIAINGNEENQEPPKEDDPDEPTGNEDGWTYAWVYENNSWGDRITAGNEAEGAIVAKFYKLEDKEDITPKNASFSGDTIPFPPGPEYELLIEGEGDMGELTTLDEEGNITVAYAWTNEVFGYLMEYLTTQQMPTEPPCIMPYVTKITIDQNITNIGHSAFSIATSLQEISIPGSVKNIERLAFYGCNSLVNLTIPNGVENIGLSAFFECTSLQSVTLPNSLINIDEEAFWGCTSLQSVTIPSGTKVIGIQAFEGCTSLENIIIPSNVETLGDYAFSDCTKLKTVTIEQGLQNMGYGSFMNSTSLESITIPNSVRSIENAVFSGCSKLNSITFNGTQEEWNAISKGEQWAISSNVSTIVCTDGTITL